MPGRLKTGQTPGKSGIVKLYCAGRCRGISRALSGFPVGRKLNQHSDTVLRLSLPAHKLSAVWFPNRASAEAANSTATLAASAQAGHQSAFRCGASAVQRNGTVFAVSGAQVGHYPVLPGWRLLCQYIVRTVRSGPNQS